MSFILDALRKSEHERQRSTAPGIAQVPFGAPHRELPRWAIALIVERFTRYLSEPPMTYLTRWRLQLAARLLERTSRGVAETAGDIGYESEAAFNRAFKREFGQPPGRYRSEHRSSPASNGARNT